MKDRIWKITMILTIILLILTFSPMIIPKHIYKPEIAGLPYSLWMSFLVTILMLFNIILATRFHPGNHK